MADRVNPNINPNILPVIPGQDSNVLDPDIAQANETHYDSNIEHRMQIRLGGFLNDDDANDNGDDNNIDLGVNRPENDSRSENQGGSFIDNLFKQVRSLLARALKSVFSPSIIPTGRISALLTAKGFLESAKSLLNGIMSYQIVKESSMFSHMALDLDGKVSGAIAEVTGAIEHWRNSEQAAKEAIKNDHQQAFPA